MWGSNSEIRLDLEMWLSFLEHPSVFCHPFMDCSTIITVEELMFYTDASKTIGMGGICGSSYVMQTWDQNFIRLANPSIAYLELYAVTVAVTLWTERFPNRKVAIFCDNMSVVHMLNTHSSSCKNCMILIRILVLTQMIHNVRIYGNISQPVPIFWQIVFQD